MNKGKQKALELIKKWEEEKRRPLSPEEKEFKAERFVLCFSLACLLIIFGAVPVHAAADDPLTIINNLSTFIFGAIKAIGIIMLGFGIVQIGLSLKSHDASQRANGLMTFFGGVIIAFAKNILDLILA